MRVWHHGDGGGVDWVAMSVVMVVFVGLLVATVVWLLQSLGRNSKRIDAAPPSASDRADDVMADRLARGDIREDEFTRSRDLMHPSSGLR